MLNSRARPPLVLLVDEDLRTSRRLADMLREDGFVVEVLADGAAAISRLARPPAPDALVSELNTAHADGSALGRFARAQRPGMPILFVTGYPHLFEPAVLGGEPPFLFVKPVDYAKLKDTLASALLAARAKLACNDVA